MNYTDHKLALEKEQAILYADLSAIAQFDKETGDWEPLPALDNLTDSDDNDLGDGFESAEEHVATLALLETRYRNVDRALKKLADDDYGTCEICLNPIESERLMVDPAARTCISHLNNEADLDI